MCSIMAFGVPKVLYGEEYVSTLQWAPVRHLDCAIACHTNTTTLNAADISTAKFRNVGFTNNGLQITYNPTYGSVTVDQLLDTAKLFKESMEVMLATEMAEGRPSLVLAWFK